MWPILYCHAVKPTKPNCLKLEQTFKLRVLYEGVVFTVTIQDSKFKSSLSYLKLNHFLEKAVHVSP